MLTLLVLFLSIPLFNSRIWELIAATGPGDEQTVIIPSFMIKALEGISQEGE
jgi:hypothetical protein